MFCCQEKTLGQYPKEEMKIRRHFFQPFFFFSFFLTADRSDLGPRYYLGVMKRDGCVDGWTSQREAWKVAPEGRQVGRLEGKLVGSLLMLCTFPGKQDNSHDGDQGWREGTECWTCEERGGRMLRPLPRSGGCGPVTSNDVGVTESSATSPALRGAESALDQDLYLIFKLVVCEFAQWSQAGRFFKKIWMPRPRSRSIPSEYFGGEMQASAFFKTTLTILVGNQF